MGGKRIQGMVRREHYGKCVDLEHTENCEWKRVVIACLAYPAPSKITALQTPVLKGSDDVSSRPLRVDRFLFSLWLLASSFSSWLLASAISRPLDAETFP